MDPIVVSALAVIHDRRLLMVTARGRSVLYLPGGKRQPGETAVDALLREAWEEIAVRLDPSSIEELFVVREQADGEPAGRAVEMTVFRATTGDGPRASNEVGSLAWVTSADAPRCPPAGVATLRLLNDLDLID